MSSHLTIVCVFIFLHASIFCRADSLPANTESENKAPKVYISLLAIGDLPPVLYKDTDKGSIWIDPPEKDFPPPILYIRNKRKKDGFDRLNLGLNTPMPPIEHPGGRIIQFFAQKPGDENEDISEYFKVALPKEKASLTIIMARDSATKNWRATPRFYLLKNDPLTFPANSVRVINLSSQAIRGRLGSGGIFNLPPSSEKVSLKILPVSTTRNVLSYQFAGNLKGTAVPIVNSATSFYQGTRLNMVVYDSDSKNTTKRLQFSSFLELPLTAEKAKTAAEN